MTLGNVGGNLGGNSQTMARGGFGGASMSPSLEVLKGGEMPPSSVTRRLFLHGLLKAMKSMAAICAITLVGGVGLTVFEQDRENEDNASLQAEMFRLNASYGFSREDFATLFPDFRYDSGEHVRFVSDTSDRHWGHLNPNTLLFSFTIVSTIGYGNFVPVTDGGKGFLIAFALLCIPLAAVFVASFAQTIIAGLQFLAIVRMRNLDQTFAKYDKDGSGTLDAEEFRFALEELGVSGLTVCYKKDAKGGYIMREQVPGDPNTFGYDYQSSTMIKSPPNTPLEKGGGKATVKFTDIVKAIDDGDNTVDLMEFKICASFLGRCSATLPPAMLAPARACLTLPGLLNVGAVCCGCPCDRS